NNAATRRHRRGGKRLRFRIKAHELIWLDTCLAVPDESIRSHGNSVWLRSLATRRLPFLHFLGRRIEMPEESALEIRVIDGSVSRNRQAARPRSLRQFVFRNGHGLGID